MRILELDSGNTRLKWRLLEAGDISAHGFIANGVEFQSEFSERLKTFGSVDRARLAVVSGQDRLGILQQEVEARLNIPLSLVEVKEECRGLRVAYTTIGVDRWLAMVAAHAGALSEHRDNSKLVVSCGTAMTMDALQADGTHLGGFIVPGIWQMKKTLNTATEQLQLVEEAASTITPGTNSADCINNGVLAMAAAMINTQLENYPDAIVYLTGGDGALVERFVKGECVYRSELVMDGMAYAFKGEI